MATPTISVTRGAAQFRVVNSHADFWSQYASGAWEPETTRVFDRCVTPESVYLDVGAWIGPTLLYAASKTRQCFGFEPDPVAFELLEANLRLNPHFASIRVFPFAIAPEHGQARIGSRSAPGDSMSSLLFSGEGASWPVETRRLEQFEEHWKPGAPVFLKIDIEGGEYSLLPHLRSFIERYRPIVLLSLHPQIAANRSRPAGLARRIVRELALFGQFMRLARVFHDYAGIYDPAGGAITRQQLVAPRVWRHLGGLVFSPQPLAFLE